MGAPLAGPPSRPWQSSWLCPVLYPRPSSSLPGKLLDVEADLLLRAECSLHMGTAGSLPLPEVKTQNRLRQMSFLVQVPHLGAPRAAVLGVACLHASDSPSSLTTPAWVMGTLARWRLAVCVHFCFYGNCFPPPECLL